MLAENRADSLGGGCRSSRGREKPPIVEKVERGIVLVMDVSDECGRRCSAFDWYSGGIRF
jgi:hypothetical protein